MTTQKHHYADCDWKVSDPCNKRIKEFGYDDHKDQKPNENQYRNRTGCEWGKIKNDVYN